MMISGATLLSLLILFVSAGDAASVQIRLVNPVDRCSGRVEIYHNGQWGTVCDDIWNINNAKVVCRQLGCGRALSAESTAHFGQGSGPIWMDNVRCSGNESSLTQCQHQGFGLHNCGHLEDAGVVCAGIPPIRLVNGNNQCSGRVEIYYNYQWGTVCDHSWDINDAEVVCREVGCAGALSAPWNAHFGQGRGRIWLDDVRCSGTESSLTQCPHRGFGSHNCGHYNDAGVVCGDFNTGGLCGTCGPDETCVSEGEVNWRCERKGLELVCGRSFMQVVLNKVDLAGLSLNASSAHLADIRCTAHNESGDAVWFQMERKAWDPVCGTQLRTNDTHSVYYNTLFIYPVANGNVSFSIPERFPISCVYPLDTNTSLDVAIRAYLSVEDADVRMGPRPGAVMSIYRNANYTDPYSEGAVVLPLGSALYVGVSAEEAASERFAVVLENCYATPSADSDDPVRLFLIQNRCPSNRHLVKVEQSGPSLPGRFAASVFLFSGNYDSIFLHCSLNMCDPQIPSCSQTCRSRVSRFVSLGNPLTIGPVTWEKVPK